MQKHIIYKITNKVNQKTYIGYHKTNNINDSYMGSGKLIKLAIQKYGLENFNKEIMHVFDNSIEAFSKERQLIEALAPEYNLHEGGSGGFDYINKSGLGGNASRARRIAKEAGFATKEKWRSIYLLGPKLCKRCHKELDFDNRKRLFCSQDCRRLSHTPWNKGIKQTDSVKNKISASLKTYYKGSGNFCKCGKKINSTGVRCIDCRQLLSSQRIRARRIEAKKLRAEGWSVKQIAVELEVKPITIYKALENMGD